MDVKKYLEAGKIVSVFGIKGEIKVQPWCDGPEFLCGFDTPINFAKLRHSSNSLCQLLSYILRLSRMQKDCSADRRQARYSLYGLHL